jgi:hypothetical protein
MPKTALQVVVDHACGLEEGIDDDRAAEAETPRLQGFGDLNR